MSFTWREFKDKKILFGDYRGLKGQEMVDNLIAVAAQIRESPTPVLVLENYEGCSVDKSFMQVGKTLGKALQPKIRKMVQLGLVTGLKKLLAQAFINFSGVNLKLMGDETTALEYLAQDETRL